MMFYFVSERMDGVLALPSYMQGTLSKSAFDTTFTRPRSANDEIH